MTVLLAGLSEKQALRWLSDAVQADIAPTLSTDELRRLLVVAAVVDVDGNLPDRFDRWEANGEYAVGEYAVPVPRNGYVYAVTVAGQGGATAPAWPVVLAQTVVSGAVTWRAEATAPWVPTYCPRALNKAAANGWRLKAGKLSANESFSADGATFNPQERRRDCLKMAAEYARKGGAGTIDLSGSIYDDYPGNVVRVV